MLIYYYFKKIKSTDDYYYRKQKIKHPCNCFNTKFNIKDISYGIINVYTKNKYYLKAKSL